MHQMLRSIFALSGLLILLCATSAFAAIELEPGLWQDTETGMENGKPAKTEVSTNCLSPEEARNPIKTILKDADGRTCETLSAKENGNIVKVDMRCGDPKEMRIEIDMTSISRARAPIAENQILGDLRWPEGDHGQDDRFKMDCGHLQEIGRSSS
jgi:hypothetical protein